MLHSVQNKTNEAVSPWFLGILSNEVQSSYNGIYKLFRVLGGLSGADNSS